MEAARREAVEEEVRALHARGDHAAAATAALRGYGPELYGFLLATHRDEQDAADVFALASEALWRSLPRFVWACSLRTWAYTIARRTSKDFRAGRRRRARAEVPLSAVSAISAIAEDVRSRTRTFARTETRDRFAALRASLAPEDQELLVLRVDRRLSWEDLARVTLDADADDAALKREAARLRKRYQLVKERLHELAEREGIGPRVREG